MIYALEIEIIVLVNQKRKIVMTGIEMRCPKCDWIPSTKLDLHLTLTRYRLVPLKKLTYSCGHFLCNFSGNPLDFLRIT